MLPSRSKPRLHLYIDQNALLIEAASALSSEQHNEPNASAALHTWLQSQGISIVGVRLEAELAGVFTRLFCLPFSPSMINPINVQRMAEAYARNALGVAAPIYYQVAEPLLYQQPPLIIGLTGQTGDVTTLNRPGLNVQPYALAVWNRYMDKLPERDCWLAVLEPAYFTLFFQRQGVIVEVLGRQLPTSPRAHLAALVRLLAQQFHRPATKCFLVDEFELLDESELPPLLESIATCCAGFKLPATAQALP